MDSRANSTREDGPVLPEIKEADERKLCDDGVHANAGAADDTATSGLLPVPKPVEPKAPSIPEVEPGNKRSPRAALASTFGQQLNKPTPTKALLPLGAKGNAAKIFPADVPRGELLAKFGSTTGDAQNDGHQQQFADKSSAGGSVVQHGGNSDQIFTPPSPFTSDASGIKMYQS